MTYQVLARKWRPQDFSSLVGQEAIVTALRNALTEGRIAQAYLFSGIRGVGKTTAARVLAKALNCERGPGADPCNECLPCREITRGSDLDVLEVDAATYSKVEQVRDLAESLKYGPARDRYKVVVLDEVHRLSRQAFDALLKIVEEPPPHLVFIFATTEADAVPVTILSRCQEFRFRRVPSLEVAALLSRIAAEEGINASDAALRLVARAGEGSVRDAVALLDQLATFGSGSISDDDAVRLLGGLDTALFFDLLAAIVRGDRVTVSQAARKIEDEGWDARNVFGQFLAFCRDALHLSMGGGVNQVDLPEEEARALSDLAREAGFENLLRLLQQMLASEPLVRRSEVGALAVEIAWLRAAELPKLVAIESLLAGGALALPQTTSAVRNEPPARAVPAARPTPPPKPAPTTPLPPRTAPPIESAPRQAAPPPAAPAGDPIGRFQAEVDRRKPPLAAHLSRAQLTFADGELVIGHEANDSLLVQNLNRGTNPQILQEALEATWGVGTRWRAAAVRSEPTPSPSPSESADRATGAAGGLSASGASGALENPTVQTLLDIFAAGDPSAVEAIEDREAEESST